MLVRLTAIAHFLIIMMSYSSFAEDVNQSQWQYTGTIGLASNNIRNGIALLDDQPTPVLSWQAQQDAGLFYGFLVDQVDIAGLVSSQEHKEWEFVFNAGYNLRLQKDWSLSADHS